MHVCSCRTRFGKSIFISDRCVTALLFRSRVLCALPRCLSWVCVFCPVAECEFLLAHHTREDMPPAGPGQLTTDGWRAKMSSPFISGTALVQSTQASQVPLGRGGGAGLSPGVQLLFCNASLLPFLLEHLINKSHGPRFLSQAFHPRGLTSNRPCVERHKLGSASDKELQEVPLCAEGSTAAFLQRKQGMLHFRVSLKEFLVQFPSPHKVIILV